jgi:hypothetical protein
MTEELPPWLIIGLIALVVIGVLTGAFVLVEWALTIAVVVAVMLAIVAGIIAAVKS